jgi:hypothetical protein
MAAGLSVVGGLVGAMGAMQAANAKAQAYTYNKMVAQRNVGVIRDQTRIQVADQKQDNKRTLHTYRAMYAHVGIDSFGSPMDVMYDTATAMNAGIRRIQYRGKLAIIEQVDQANLDQMGAENAIKEGQISAISSILGGLTSAVSSISGSGSGGGFGSVFGGGGGYAAPAAAPSMTLIPPIPRLDPRIPVTGPGGLIAGPV